MADLQLLQLDRPALFDTGVWTWVRDRRFPELATWFNAAVEAGLILVCDLVAAVVGLTAIEEGLATDDMVRKGPRRERTPPRSRP